MADIIIKEPKLVSVNEDKTRLVTDLIIDGQSIPIWVEADNKYREYMVVENCDASLCFVVIFAMRERYDIICEAPVTEILLYKLNEFAQIGHTYNDRLHLPKISANTCDPLPNEKAVVTTASFGVDSSYAISKFINPSYPSLKLTHLMHNDVLEFSDFSRRYKCYFKTPAEEAVKTANQVKAFYRNKVIEVAGELNLEYCFFDTNFKSFSKFFPLVSKYYITYMNSGFVAHSFAKLFGTVIVPGAYDISHFTVNNILYCDSTDYEVLNLYMLSTGNFGVGINFIADTFCMDRLDKTKALIGNSVIENHLSVCWFTQNGKNCNTCPKCKRTLIMLDYLGVVDRFADVFDIDYYNKNFDSLYKEYLIYGVDIKFNLHNNEKRYRQLRDTVLLKHCHGKSKKIAVKWAIAKGKTILRLKKIVKWNLRKMPKMEELVAKMYKK